MVRLRRWREFLAALVGLGVAAVVVWLQFPAHPVLDVMGISNVQFHSQLAEVGLGGESLPGAVRVLVWDRPPHDEAGVAELIGSLHPGPAVVAAGPHTDFVSALGSTHVSVPVIDSIAGFSNGSTDVWILSQRYMTPPQFAWQTYAIVQDKTLTPNRAFYLQVWPNRVEFKGNECFTCHVSGPRFMRPLRADLITNGTVMTAFNERIVSNAYVGTHFAAAYPQEPLGPALTATACVSCHQIGAERSPLWHAQDESIRALVTTGAMPRDGRLSPAQAAEIQAWLDAKRE